MINVTFWRNVLFLVANIPFLVMQIAFLVQDCVWSHDQEVENSPTEKNVIFANEKHNIHLQNVTLFMVAMSELEP